MENHILYFNKHGINYYYIGHPSHYFYEAGVIPINDNSSYNILEKTQIIHSLWEPFNYAIDSKSLTSTSIELLSELNTYFSQYDEQELAYWALFDYETLIEYDTHSYSFELDQQNDFLVLNCLEIKIFIPPPYENLVTEDNDGSILDVDENNFMQFKSLTFSQDLDFPFIFMSQQQYEENSIVINNYFDEIVLIFRKHNIEINSWRDIANFCNQYH